MPKRLNAIAGMTTVVSGLAATLYYWQTNRAIAYGSILAFAIGVVWLNFRPRQGGQKVSLEEIIDLLEAHAQSSSALSITREKIETLQALNRPELIGDDKLLIKDPKSYGQKLGNWLYTTTSRTKLSKFCFKKVFLKKVVGMTICLVTDLWVITGLELFGNFMTYLVFSCGFLRLHFLLLGNSHGPASLDLIVQWVNSLIQTVGIPRLAPTGLPGILQQFGVTLYLALATTYQFYSLIPRVYDIGPGSALLLKGSGGSTEGDEKSNETSEIVKFIALSVGRIAWSNMALFIVSLALFAMMLVCGQLARVTLLGFDGGFIAAYSLILFVGLRRLTYSVSMMIIGSYIIVVIASIAKSC